MNCDEIQELFGVYWDLPSNDERRLQVREHIKSCRQCAEEFEIWEESTNLIRSTQEETVPAMSDAIAGGVMSRIYEAESWRLPIPERVYMISLKMRRNITAAIVCSMALFVFSFLYSLFYNGTTASQNTAFKTDHSIYGLQPVASVNPDSMDVHAMSSAVASLSDPFLLKVGPIHTIPDYMLAISMLGMVCTLLIMNWLSRTRV
jgi:predicted anti-sigma-YlaC factor YlaD